MSIVPVRGEFGLLEAAQWGECFEEVGPEQWLALCAWVESGAHIVEGHGPIPGVPDFEERYCGHWDSFREYAEDLAESTGLMTDCPRRRSGTSTGRAGPATSSGSSQMRV